MINRGDSFHDCWANIGTLIRMKDSIQSAIAPSATGSSHIRAASRRVEAMGASVGNPVQPPTVFELEGGAGRAGADARTVGKELAKPGLSSQLATGDAALAKQVVMGRWVLDSQNPPGKNGLIEG
jgi:hypothetical protein